MQKRTSKDLAEGPTLKEIIKAGAGSGSRMRISPRIRKWLTGPKSDPSIRARFWLEVEGRSSRNPKVKAALKEIGRTGWAASLLDYQLPDGHWVTPGTSGGDLYRPKYIVTNWHAIVLADLGVTRSDPRIRRTAEMILDRWSGRGGDLSGRSGEICVTGNAVRTLVRFGYLEHPVVQQSIAWILKTQKPDGGWHCFPSRVGTLDGWEGLAAFAEIPENARDASIRRSIERGAEFYLRRHLMREGRVRYPPWFRIHYPNHYYYDVLVGLRILTRLGYGADPRLAPALRWLRSKRARDGTWALDAAHPDLDPAHGGYVFEDLCFPMLLEPLHEPSQWATVEALSVLARTGSPVE
jgi:Prenyltransferase and squalene oxidase repeat